MKRQLVILAAGLCVALAGCDRKPKPAAEAPPAPAVAASTAVEPVPGATINEIMSQQSEPSADIVWGAAKVVSNATGMHDYRPTTDAEWAKVEKAARTLIGVAKLVVQPGRQIVRPGVPIEAGGTLDAAGIEKAIAANRPAFLEKAKGLDAAANQALTAIKARDVAKLEEAGGNIDEACEACHLQFYYPPPAAGK